ncbi:MAG: O-antigen ligase family protein [Bacteroidetes bacterium]|nr:O-antigen ligase family protein [Bacteroidota bacterium]
MRFAVRLDFPHLWWGTFVASCAGALAGVLWITPERAWLWPLLLLGLFACAVSLWRLEWGFVSLLVLNVFGLLDVSPGIGAAELALSAYTLLFGLRWLYEKTLRLREPILDSPMAWAVAVFLGAVFVSGLLGLLYGNAPELVLRDLKRYLVFVLFFFLYDLFKRRPALVGYHLGIFLGIAIGFSLYNAAEFFRDLSGARSVWQAVQAREAKYYLVFFPAIVLCTAFLLYHRNWLLRTFFGLSALACTAALLLTFSRGPWLATALGLLVMAALVERRDQRLLLLYVLGLVAAGVGVVLALAGPQLTLLAAGLAGRLLSIGRALEADLSVLNRFAEWRAAWEALSPNWITGWGLGATYPFVNIITLRYLPAWDYIHNNFLFVWMTTGLAGLLAQLLFYGSGLWTTWRAWRLSSDRFERYVLAASIGILIGMLLMLGTEAAWAMYDGIFATVSSIAIGAATWRRRS